MPDGDLSRVVSTYWGVGDVATCVERATAIGAEVLEAPHDVGDGIVVGAVRNLTSPRGAEGPVTAD